LQEVWYVYSLVEYAAIETAYLKIKSSLERIKSCAWRKKFSQYRIQNFYGEDAHPLP